MTTLRTILHDLAATAAKAAQRALAKRGPGDGASDGVEVPTLSTVEESRSGRSGTDRPDGDEHEGDRDAGSDHGGGDQARDERRRRRDDDGVASPGQLGPDATVEVDPDQLDLVHTSYNPDTDGAPDPGEVVWTWVPYEEADGRGKDRPVLVVARLDSDEVLAIQLSSQDHDGDHGWVALGAGAWDGEHRPSWVDLSRVLLVRPDGMRREAATLDRDRFDRVTHALSQRYRWPT